MNLAIVDGDLGTRDIWNQGTLDTLRMLAGHGGYSGVGGQREGVVSVSSVCPVRKEVMSTAVRGAGWSP